MIVKTTCIKYYDKIAAGCVDFFPARLNFAHFYFDNILDWVSITYFIAGPGYKEAAIKHKASS
jgi:hypothetical protein